MAEVTPEGSLWAQVIHSLQTLLFPQFGRVNFDQIFVPHLYHTSLKSEDNLTLRCCQLNPSPAVTLGGLRQVSQPSVRQASSWVTRNS